MRAKLWLVGLLIVVVAAPLQAGAQTGEEDETWYFTFTLTDDGSTIGAINAAGDMNILLENVDWVNGWRVGPQSALLMVEVGDDAYMLYHLTPDSAEPIAIPPEVAELEQDPFVANIVGPDPNYVVFHSGYIFGPGVVVNLENKTVSLLTDGLGITQSCCRFSADGQYLRYISGDREAENSHLWERNLATGGEHAFFTWDDTSYWPAPPDRYGERWLYRETQNEEGARTSTTYLIHPDETVTVLGEEPQTSDYAPTWTLHADYLVYYDFVCEANCEVEIHPLDGGPPLMTFTLPSIDASTLNVIHYQGKRFLQATEYALVLQNPVYWLATPYDPPAQLGYLARTLIVSPDGRWVVTATDEDGTGYRLWDLQTGDYVMEGGDTIGLITSFGESGFFVWETASEDRPAYFYRHADGAVLDLLEDFSYREVLPDGTLLAVITPARTDDTGRLAGTYRYDPETGNAELLAADVHLLPIRDPVSIQ